MKKMNLSKRMESVVDMVLPQVFAIADVGCDHAYISIALIQRSIADKVIAMDVREGPLQIATENVKTAELEDKIDLRLSDGLEGLSPGEVDSVIIAGMGGLLIRDILEGGKHILACEKKRPVLILQPQSDLQEVRIFLYDHAYHIVREKMLIDEGKYYTIIKAEPCSQAEADRESKEYTKADWLYGNCNLKQRNEVLHTFLQKECAALEEIHSKLSGLVKREESDEQKLSQKMRNRWKLLQEEMETNHIAMEYYRNL